MGLFTKVHSIRQQMANLIDNVKLQREIAKYEKELLINPENIFAITQLANLYQENSQLEKAVTLLCIAAELHLNKKEFELTLALYRKAERLGNGEQRLSTLRQLVDLYLQLQKYKEAYQRICQIIEILLASEQINAALGLVSTLQSLGPNDAQYRKELTEMINITRNEWTQGSKGTWITSNSSNTPEEIVNQNIEKFPNHTILLVDDEPGILHILSTIFKQLGCNILTAVNGEEGLSLAVEHTPNLIISDLLMPKMDGSQLFAKLREHPTLNKIPFVCLTSRGQEMEKVSALDQGVEDYWIKPFSASELLIRVKRLLKKLIPKVDIEGQLSQISFIEIIQMLEAGTKTGILTLRSKDKMASMFIEQGQIITASMNKFSNAVVIYKLIYWTEGEFYFVSHAPTTSTNNINLSTQQLLLESIRRFDEFYRIKAKLSNLLLTYIYTDELFHMAIEQEFLPNLSRIKELFNGINTLEKCISMLEGEIETLVIVEELIEQKIIIPTQEIQL